MAAQDTPVMQQHAAAKRGHPDCIVFFRLGDFYEMFGEDAVLAAPLLDLTLTSRNRGKPDEIPMAGVPHHAAHSYIARLLEKGHRVALCEQMADPKTVRGIVPREVVRVLTPGTWSESPELEHAENNFLAAIDLSAEGEVGVAVLDISTAELRAIEVADLAMAFAELGRLNAREVLVAGDSAAAVAADLKRAFPRAAVRVDEGARVPELAAGLEGASLFSAAVAGAVERVLGYARRCLPQKKLELYRVALLNPTAYLELGAAAQAHLELVRSNSSAEGTTLLEVLDQTETAFGSRLLRSRLLGPLLDPSEIRARLLEVRTLFERDPLRAGLRAELARVPDLERLCVRVVYGEATPRDLGAIRRGLSAAAAIHALLALAPPTLGPLRVPPTGLDVLPELHALLEAALVERPPVLSKEGSIFREGYDAELDRLAVARLEGSSDIAAVEATLREETGISNLRVKYTRVFGWYIEVTRSQAGRAPSDWSRKQTVASGERFTTPRLDELAASMLESEERFRERELELFGTVVASAASAARRIHALGHMLAALDVSASLAEVARQFDYVEPIIEDVPSLVLHEARHPVVERMNRLERFVPNDVDLGAQSSKLWLITGPNMAGKSTFLRQTALAVVMAQMGSFVAAKSARIGIVDKVLSRLGANDNLALGESTFMVEMREMAHILRTATQSSLVIVDEIGRGTSTFDGMAIAWSVLEYLSNEVRCRCLFATHYQELTAEAARSSAVENHSVAAIEAEGKITFLHRVQPGAAARSYGVSVAELAGLPARVVGGARSRLAELESSAGGRTGAASGVAESPAASTARGLNEAELELLSELGAAHLDSWNGLKALEFLHALQEASGRGAAARAKRS